MSSKSLNHIKKIIVMLTIIIMCSPSMAHAISFGTGSSSTGGFSSFFSKIFNFNKYDMGDLKLDLGNMKDTGNFDMSKISGLIGKLPNSEDKNMLEGIMDKFKEIFPSGNTTDKSESGLLDTLLGAVTGLLGGSGGELAVEPTSINIDAKTAVEFAGNDYKAKLHARVYMNDENSGKWAVLIHPFLLNGKMMANTVGPFYYDLGYNILAVDLRGFGDSEGSVALGLLESLDLYDWLNELNNKYKTEEVVVHGISLGAATTNFLSGIDGMMNNGPVKLNTQLKSIKELHVKALVEDCGYVKMEDFAGETFLNILGVGIPKGHFDYYSNATNSLKYCDIPMLIIHGTSDTTVKPENADTVKNTVKGPVEQWKVSGGAHAFIIMGSNKAEYQNKVQNFVQNNTDTSTTTKPSTPSNPTTTPDIEEEKQEETKGGFLQKILSIFKGFRK